MEKKKNASKSLIVGVVAVVVLLAAVLAVLLLNCRGEVEPTATAAPETTGAVEDYVLYYNMDRALYAGKTEAGMSSRVQEEDGYFHLRMLCEGEEVVVKTSDRRVVNKLDYFDLCGLEFDDQGLVTGVIDLEEMPLQKVGWKFYVQSVASTAIKINSSRKFDGMPILLKDFDPQRIWDMTDVVGKPGRVDMPIEGDVLLTVQNLAGETTHIFIVARPEYMLTHEAHCQHCDNTVTWKEWVKTEELPVSSGHYQLVTDVQLKGQTSTLEDAKICLDLNGHRVDGKKGTRIYSVFNPGGALAIMDTSEGETGVLAGHGPSLDGGACLWVRYGALYLYSGTVDASDMSTTGNGAAVFVRPNSYFYMLGGTVKGGTANYTYDSKTNTYEAGLGGNIYVSGKFVLSGGVIKDGQALAGTRYWANGSKTLERGFGGNVYVGGSGEFEMNGGTIENGRAGSSGANIYGGTTSTTTINGGVVKNGVIKGAGRNGGNMYFSGKTTLIMNGGSILGGVSYNGGANLYTNGRFVMNGGYIGGGVCYSSATGKPNPDNRNYNLMMVNGRFDMYGGKIAGGVAVADTSATDQKRATVVLSGYATITDGPNGSNFYIASGGGGVKVLVGTLYDSAKIGVNTSENLFSEPTNEQNLDNFISDVEGAEVVYYQERLGLGRLRCLCGQESHTRGCDGKVLLWSPWISKASLPTATGNYYLLNDVVRSAQTTVTAGKEIRLDLNGHNATLRVQPSSYDGFRLLRVDSRSTYAITDTTEKPGTLTTVMPGEDAVYPGTTLKSLVKDDAGNVVEKTYYTEEEMRAYWAGGNSGMLLWSRGGQISIHNGIWDGSGLSGNKNGLLFYVGDEVITDAETKKQTTIYGSIRIYGGTILGGTTTTGGNIALKQGTSLELMGGTITGGVGKSGGNISALADSVVKISGGTVANGEATGTGGNIYSEGLVEITGGTVTGGNSVGAGGNIYGPTTSRIRISGGTMENGTRGGKASTSGNVVVVNGRLELSGGVIQGDSMVASTKKEGGRLVLSGKPVVNMGKVAGMTFVLEEAAVGTLLMDISGVLEEGASVNVAGRGFISDEVEDGNAQFIHSDMGYETLWAEKKIFLGKYTCLCDQQTHTTGCVAAMARLGLDPTAGDKLPLLPVVGIADLQNGGYWYLPKALTTQQGVYLQDDVPLVLDLNGFALNVNSSFCFISSQTAQKSATLIITDKPGDKGTIKMTSNKTTTNQGGILRVAGVDAKVYLLGGTLDASGYQLESHLGGAAVYITGGNAMEQYGGVIRGRSGAGISGGSSVHISNGSYGLHGGSILGGQATKGGNVYVSNSNASFVMTDGLITDGKADQGANLYVGAGAAAKLSGGTVAGGMYVNSDGVSLTGGLVVDKAKSETASLAPAESLFLASGCKLRVEGLTGQVLLTGTVGQQVATGAAASQENTNVCSETVLGGSLIPLEFRDGGLHLGRQADMYCTCGGTKNGYACAAEGCDGQIHYWIPWTDDTKLPAESGYWRLTKTVDVGTVNTLSTAKEIYLDLNGQTVNLQDNEDLYTLTKNVETTVVITDASGKTGNEVGKVVLSGTSNQNGGFAELNIGHTFELYRATLDASGLRLNGNANGGAFSVRKTAQFVLHSGTVVGGSVSNRGGSFWIVEGAQVTMKGGTIRDGHADTAAGNIYVTSANSLFTMENGTVTGGTGPNGDNVFLNSADATFRMTGGTVTGGVYVAAAKEFVVTGNAVINKELTDSKYAKPGYSLKLASGKKANVSGLTGTVYVTAESGTVFATGEAALANTKVLSEVKVGAVILPILVKNSNELYLDEASSIHCICGGTKNGYACAAEGCDGQLHYWKPWTDGTKLPAESGYWRLTKTVDVGTVNTLSTAKEIYLDLNGQTVNLQNNEDLYSLTKNVETTVVITDASGKTGSEVGKVVLTGESSGNGGIFYIPEKNTVKLYRATLDASNYTTKENGAAIALRGNFEMFSGTVLGGQAKSTNTKNGGALWLSNDAKVTIHSGTVVGGYADSKAGTIYVTANAVLEIKGGLITGGDAKTDGDNIHLNSADATFRMTGGTVTGGVYVAAAKEFVVTGNAVINKELTDSKYAKPGYSLKLASGKKANVSGLTGTVYVTAESGTVFATGEAALANTKVLSEVKVGTEILPILVKNSNELYLDEASSIHCICGGTKNGYACAAEGCDGQLHYWKPWTDGTKLPAESGYWRLTKTVDVGTVNTLSTAKEIYLDLNGQTVNLQNNENIYYLTTGVTAHVVITDASGKTGNEVGKVVLSGTSNQNGGFAELTTGHTFELYRATLDASGLRLNENANGGAFSVRKTARFLLHSGTVVGGSVSSRGGSFWIVEGAQVTMKGGTIRDGHADTAAGNIYVTGANSLFTMENGTVSGGTSPDGANVRINPDSKFILKKGTVTGGVATKYGGNFSVGGILEITGGTVTGGVAGAGVNNGRGGNIYISGSTAEFTVTNATITDGGRLANEAVSATNTTKVGAEFYGGNIAVVGVGAKVFTIGANTVVENGRAHRGANIYIHVGQTTTTGSANTTYTITGATIREGRCGNMGSNICVWGASEALAPVVTATNTTFSIDMTALSKDTSAAKNYSARNVVVGYGTEYNTSWAKLVLVGGSVSGGNIVLYPKCTLDYSAGTTTLDPASIIPIGSNSLGTVIKP